MARSRRDAFGEKRWETDVLVVPRARVNQFHTLEFDLVAAKPDYLWLPVEILVVKEAGAYTVTSIPANGLVVGWGTVAENIPAGQWGPSPAFSLLVGTGRSPAWQPHMIMSNGSSGGLPFGNTFPDAVIGKKLAMRTLTASPGGAGGDLRVKLWYKAYHSSYFDI